MKAFIKFNRGVLKLPVHWQAWMMILLGANLIAPLVFLNHLEAQVTLATFLLSATLMTLLTARFGFTRILGLGHIFWIPLLAFLIPRLNSIPTDSFFGIWIRVLVILNGISLVIDVVEFVRYIAGDRQETVTGLN